MIFTRVVQHCERQAGPNPNWHCHPANRNKNREPSRSALQHTGPLRASSRSSSRGRSRWSWSTVQGLTRSAMQHFGLGRAFTGLGCKSVGKTRSPCFEQGKKGKRWPLLLGVLLPKISLSYPNSLTHGDGGKYCWMLAKK